MDTATPKPGEFDWKKVEEYFRKQPLQGTLLAFAVGFGLTKGPLRRLLLLPLKIALLLVKPSLFVYGAIKAYQYVAAQTSRPRGQKF